MAVYAAIGGVLLLLGFVVYLALRWMRSDAKTSAKQAEIIKQIYIDNNIMQAQRDTAINSHVDPKAPDDVLSKL